MEKRDSLVLVYETLKAAIKKVHGEGFPVFDDKPNVDLFLKKQRNAANISYVSGSIEKALMREYVPHKLRNNKNGTFTVATETARFHYTMRITFFAEKKGLAQRLGLLFLEAVEEANQFVVPGDEWEEVMEVLSLEPPRPPDGEADLWFCSLMVTCRGKLLTESTVNEIGAINFKGKITTI